MNRLRAAKIVLGLVLAGFLAAACAPAPFQPQQPTPTLRALPSLQPTMLTMECVAVSVAPTLGPTAESLFPPPGADDHSLGSEIAPVTFLVYTDFQSSAAAGLDAVMRRLYQKYPQYIRWVQRPFPIPNSDKGILSAAAAEAAGRQDRYWEMSAALFMNQAVWSPSDDLEFQDWLAQQAGALGMDVGRFTQDLRDPQLKTDLDIARRFGLETGISLIPFILVNGQIYQGPHDLRSLENLVNLLQMEASQFTECPPLVIEVEKEYTAQLETTRGLIVLQLYPREAPWAVNNFVFLASQGWYDGVPFHRVIAGELAQSGDPSGTGYGSPGYAFADEFSGLRFDRPGVLAMANAGPDSNGSQFFITLRALPALDGKHTIFGQVLSGMDVLDALVARDPSQADELPEPDRILNVSVQEK